MKHIYYNAVIHAAKGLIEEAMGVENGRIAVIGTEEKVRDWSKGIDEVWHDMKGRFIVPGFIDTHLHVLEYGYGLSTADLTGDTFSLKEMLQCLTNFKDSRKLEEGSWIVGRGWNHDYFQDEKRFPTRKDLDQVSSVHPVIVYRACGHIACVNSVALQKAGITGKTLQPEGGCFDIDGNGEPTGVLREYAIDLVSRIIPPPTKEMIKSFLIQSMRKLNTFGITSVQTDDLATFPGVPFETILNAYRELEKEGLLTVKVYEQSRLSDMSSLKEFLAKGNKTGTGSRLFSIGPLKLIGDGSLGARTAYLSRPYADDSEDKENCGIPIYTQDELDERIVYAASHGMQIAVHAIGDKTMSMVIDSIEKAMNGETLNPLRHGIIHCQITTKELLEKFKKLHLHAYIQSIFLDYDNHIVEKRVGAERAADTYQFKTLMDMGVEVSNGSDAPVEGPNVLAGIQCAVTRTTLDGSKTFLPDQALSVDEALNTYTYLAAKASFEEEEKGKLLPGMAADFTVLSENLSLCAPEKIKDVSVMQTFLDGVCVYENPQDYS